MAKKKKQKKAGLAKRQKGKQEKKRAQKRKLQAQKPVQRKLKASKVKQNLKNLPNLIFEPELEEIAFSPEQIKEAVATHEKVPDQIEAIATIEFQEKLESKLQVLKLQFDRVNDVNKSMMVQAILYFMEHEQAPPFLNQIIVGMFLRGQAEMTSAETPITLKELNPMLKEYDETWESYLEEKMLLLEDAAADPGMEAAPGDIPEVDEDEEVLVPSPFEPLIEKFVGYLESDANMDEEIRERTQEDIEVLFNDYFEEKGITQFEEVSSRRVKSFLEGWFIRTMHPTGEDLEIMVDSLKIFFKFTETREIVPSETNQEILQLLENKEAILANLNV